MIQVDRDVERVLNAFRRHCGYHACLERGLTAAHVCSTPFGVTAVITAAPAMQKVTIVDHVLNAFRRHCGYHSVLFIPVAVSFFSAQRLSASLRLSRHRRHHGRSTSQCSTPFGVTAVITKAPATIQPRRVGAQRLSASLRLSPFPVYVECISILTMPPFKDWVRGRLLGAKIAPKTAIVE